MQTNWNYSNEFSSGDECHVVCVGFPSIRMSFGKAGTIILEEQVKSLSENSQGNCNLFIDDNTMTNMLT